MTYYLKYRSQKLDELDLENVRESLKRIVSSGNIPHAFLFSGPKGTGKTSAARIVAKIVNCENLEKDGEPCNKCKSCKAITRGESLDIVEIDAASHRGIDDIRSLKDAVKLAPAKAKKKVYIIDEAHMLTTEASNALLKTLEEPPSHVIFILATTNPEKLIETIRSRTTNIVFTNANMEEVKRSLARVIKGERLKVDDEIVEMVVKAAKGSFRDSHKILEQLVNEGIISDKNKVEEYLFKGQASNVEELLHAVSEKNVKEALKLIEKAVSQGVALDDFSESFLARLHANLLAKEGIGKDELGKLSKSELIGLIKLIGEAYDKMRFSFIEQLPLEIAIVEWAGGGRKVRDSDEKERVLEQNGQTGKDGENGRSTMGGLLKAHQTSVANGNGNGGINDKMWKEILQAVKPKNTSIEALLRAAKPLEYDGNTLKLGVFYKFHKERLEEGHHRKILEEVAAGVLGGETRIICTLTKPPAIKNPEKQLARDKDVVLTESDDEDIINVAKEIFGN